VCDTRLMSTSLTNRCKHHRFPAEIISHGVWLSFRIGVTIPAVMPPHAR
jgi:hypothetical protein